MLIFGFIMIILSIVAAFAIGFLISKWNGVASYFSFVLLTYFSFVLLIISVSFGILLFYEGAEKETLIFYENGDISYKVTNVDVEHNKTTDIRVIYNTQKDED